MRGIGPVHLVDDEHDGQARLERLAQHEPGLGEGSFGRVDEEQDAVDHREAPFDLAAEVRVTRRVDDVQLHAAPAHGRVLGQDGDALLALEVARVHHAVGQLLMGPERARLTEQGVDQRGLAVVDVRHDGHVPDVVARSHGGANDRGRAPVPRPQPCLKASTAGSGRRPHRSAGAARSARAPRPRWRDAAPRVRARAGRHDPTRATTRPRGPAGTGDRDRNASTRATSASSDRTESRRGPLRTTRCAPVVRTSARPRSASSAEWGLSHQRSRPMTGGGCRTRPSRGRTTGGSPTSPPRPRRRRARPP